MPPLTAFTITCGVHLNLNEGYPVRKIASSSPLTRADGQFRSRRSVLMHGLRPSAQFLRLAEDELSAQIEQFLTSGLIAYHLTTHSHFHIVPALRDLIMRLARKFHVGWVRQHRLSATVLPVNPLFTRKHVVTETPNQPNYVVPIIFWTERAPALLAKQIDALQGRIEIVVHPSTVDDATFPIDADYLPAKRYKEMQYLERFLTLSGLRVQEN